MKESPCCAGLMRSCLHTYRTKTNLTQHIIQPWGGGIRQVWVGEVINQLWGGHQPSMGGAISQVWGGSSAKYGGAISQVWGGSSTKLWGGISQVWGGYLFSHQYVQEVKIHRITLGNTYVLPSVNRTAGPTIHTCIPPANAFSQFDMHSSKLTMFARIILNIFFATAFCLKLVE